MRIFISYRRKDTETIVGRIEDRLVKAFGRANIIRDIGSMPPGVDIDDWIKEALEKCDVVLIVIGSQWQDIKDDDGNRRLDDPKDRVRVEAQTALKRGIGIPVHVGEFHTLDKIPRSLRRLRSKNSSIVRSGSDFNNDVNALINSIKSGRFSFARNLIFYTVILAIILILGLSANAVLPKFMNSPTVIYTQMPEIRFAYEFLVDTSANMALTVGSGGKTRYEITLNAIKNILSPIGNISEDTWFTIRTMGGSEGEICDKTDVIEQGRGTHSDQQLINIINGLEAIKPQGNTAYDAGLEAVINDMKLPEPSKTNSKLLVIFIGSFQSVGNCPDDRVFDPDIDLMVLKLKQTVENYGIEGISTVLCLGTFFDEATAQKLEAELSVAIGSDESCTQNIVNESTALNFADSVRRIYITTYNKSYNATIVPPVPTLANTLATFFSPTPAQGCDEDRDCDGIADLIDNCQDAPGPRENLGCPQVNLTATIFTATLTTPDRLETLQALLTETDEFLIPYTDCRKADVNGDNVVDAEDYNQISNLLGEISGNQNYQEIYDIDLNGIINGEDLKFVIDRISMICEN